MTPGPKMQIHWENCHGKGVYLKNHGEGSVLDWVPLGEHVV